MPTFNLESNYVPDDVRMDIHYDIELNGDYSLFDEYFVGMEVNHDLMKLPTPLIGGKFVGNETDVAEGTVIFKVMAMFNQELILIGEKEITIEYPAPDLSNVTVNKSTNFDKEARHSELVLEPSIIDKKVNDTYKLIVTNSDRQVLKDVDITNSSERIILENLLHDLYTIKVIEYKGNHEFTILEENYEFNYPNDFFTNIVTSNVEYTPTFSGDNKIADLKIKPVIDRKYVNNNYYITVDKGQYFSYISDNFKLDDNFEYTFHNFKPGIYNIKIYIYEDMNDSVIYEQDYEFVYPTNFLQVLLNYHLDFDPQYYYDEKISTINIIPHVDNYFDDALFKINISGVNNYEYTSELFKATYNFSHLIENAEEGIYNVTFSALIDGVEYELENSPYRHTYPEDFDTLPDTNNATYNKITSKEVTIDDKTKEGFYLVNVPINYETSDSRYCYDISINEGQYNLAERINCIERNPVVELENIDLYRVNILIEFKVREGTKEKIVETYTVDGDLYLGGPIVRITNYKLVEDGKIIIPYEVDYEPNVEILKTLSYEVKFNDGYKVTNTVNFDPNNLELIITGFQHDVTSMTVDINLVYDAPYGMGEKTFIMPQESYQFPKAPIIQRSLVRAADARVEGENNIELDFLYFGKTDNQLVIKENGNIIHQGGFSYKGPLDTTQTNYEYYMTDAQGNSLCDAVTLVIDALTIPTYEMTTLVEDDVVVTNNNDGTYNYYMNFNFTSAKDSCYYVVNMYSVVEQQQVLYKSVKSRSKVFVLEDVPLSDCIVEYQVYQDECLLTYVYTNNQVLNLFTNDYYRYVDATIARNNGYNISITTQPLFDFDKTSAKIVFQDGTSININETDWILNDQGGYQAEINVDKKDAKIIIQGTFNSKNYDVINGLVQIKGNKYREYIIEPISIS